MISGSFKAKADPASVSFGVSSNGNEQIAVDLAITQGEHAGTRVTWIGSFASESAIEITMRQFRQLGARCQDGSIMDMHGLGVPEVDIRIDLEEYGGQTRQRVSILSGFSFRRTLDAAGLARLDKRLRAMSAAKGAAPRASVTPPDADTGGNDIPF
jgi:hypothetical protein